jgi:hypothetical protein
MRDQMKRGLRTAVISLALGMVFVGSLARADDCKDALIAESCACQSAARSEGGKLNASRKSLHAKKSARATNHATTRVARSSGSNENSVAAK